MNLAEEISETEMPQSAAAESIEAPRCPECGNRMLPVKLQDDSGSTVHLRCFVRKAAPRGYIAECIDLDLAAESETEEGAISSLSDAIFGYLMVVLEGVKTDQDMPVAVLRPSPLSHRLRYHLEFFKCWISGAFSRDLRRLCAKFYEAPFGLNDTQCRA